MSSLNRNRNNRTRWIAGDVLSWALGVTLGVVLGIALLIVLPRTLPKPGGAAAPSTEGTIVAPAETPQAGSGTQSAAANAALGNDSNNANESAQGEVAPTGGTRDSDIQTTDDNGMSMGGDPASSESTDAARGATTNTDGGTEGGNAGTTEGAGNAGSSASGSGSTGTGSTNTDAGGTGASGAATTNEGGNATSGSADSSRGATDANDNGAQTAAEQRANTNEDSSDTQNPDDETGTDTGTTQGTNPDEAAARNTDPAGDPTNGRAVFASNCAGCHGANGGGNIGPALNTADGPKSWTLAEFTLALRQGKTPERELNSTMPRYSETQITDEQIADLQAYIKTLN